jgi:hypothetical protein
MGKYPLKFEVKKIRPKPVSEKKNRSKLTQKIACSAVRLSLPELSFASSSLHAVVVNLVNKPKRRSINSPPPPNLPQQSTKP